MRWQHCAEVVFISLVFVSVFALVLWAIAAIVRAYRIAKPLRENPPQDKVADRSALTEEQKAKVDQHWQTVRDRSKAYSEDIGRTAAQLKRDAIEYVKESQNWGRLAVQYALIGNAGALAALPYLLSWQRSTTPGITQLSVGDATWSAIWFAGGLLTAALVCAIAYVDFQINAAIHWNDVDVEYKLAAQRHYDTEINGQDIPLRQQIRTELRTVSVRTSLAGLHLALLAWFSLAWGTVRLIVSLQAFAPGA